MKQLLLFVIFIFLSISVFSQIQGPPPPCGYFPVYVCDFDNDGIEQFNLLELYPFSTFCAVNIGEIEENYSDVVFYHTREDMYNEINPISNPESFVNTFRTQVIFCRVNAINGSAGFDYLTHEDLIEILNVPSPNTPTPLILCNSNNNGINTFNLSTKNDEILAGLDPNLYQVNYFESLNDAESNTNPIPAGSYTNIANPQTVYARANHLYNVPNCFDIVPLELKVDLVCKDIVTHFLYTNRFGPRPGFETINTILVRNFSPETSISESFEVVIDSQLEFVEVFNVNSQYTITDTPTGFILNLINLPPNAREEIYVRMYVPVSLPLGSYVTNEVTYLGTDSRLTNNYSSITGIVRGSYDPNDITESQGPEIFYDDFTSNDYLYYTIRFQNVGNADAINVSIDNTLDPKLDKSSIQMLASSHNHVFTRTNNQLNWKFDNIHLPSESMDEPNSHGYVYYKIKPTAGFQVGDIIPNTAEIYFDFNPAVVTNTFETEFVATLSNEKFDEVNYVMFPNPTNNFVEIKFSKNTSNKIQLGVYDIQGKLILEDKRELQNNATMLDISNLRSGMYFLKINDGTGQMTQKLIVN
jgi:Secretion system C-terminal sorting domain